MSTPGAEAGNPDGSEVQGESPYRLFVALAVAEAAKEHISYVQRDVGRLLGNHVVVWEPRENFRISLRFLGDTPGRRVSEAVQMIGAVASDHAPSICLPPDCGCSSRTAGRVCCISRSALR